MRRDIKKILQLRRMQCVTRREGKGIAVRNSIVVVRKYMATVSEQVQMTSDKNNYRQ